MISLFIISINLTGYYSVYRMRKNADFVYTYTSNVTSKKTFIQGSIRTMLLDAVNDTNLSFVGIASLNNNRV